jgi:hypothetical protein
VKKFGKALLILFIGVVGLSIYKMLRSMVDYTQIPGQIKICDLTNASIRADFTFPKANHLHLILGVSNQVPQFQIGAMNFYKGNTLVRRYEFQTNDIQKSNWLDKHGLTGYILNWGFSNDSPNLELYFSPNQTNRVILDFDRLPATNASLWLSYLQFLKDAKGE